VAPADQAVGKVTQLECYYALWELVHSRIYARACTSTEPAIRQWSEKNQDQEGNGSRQNTSSNSLLVSQESAQWSPVQKLNYVQHPSRFKMVITYSRHDVSNPRKEDT
jgi:hypothetical protein